MKGKEYCNVRDHCYYTVEYRGDVHNIYNFRYNAPKVDAIVFLNESNYDYHFNKKELVEELNKKNSILV